MIEAPFWIRTPPPQLPAPLAQYAECYVIEKIERNGDAYLTHTENTDDRVNYRLRKVKTIYLIRTPVIRSVPLVPGVFVTSLSVNDAGTL